MTTLAIVGSATRTSLMSRGRSMTRDLLTPSATECDETSLAAIWMVCIGGERSAGASPATLACQGTSHDTAIRPA